MWIRLGVSFNYLETEQTKQCQYMGVRECVIIEETQDRQFMKCKHDFSFICDYISLLDWYVMLPIY